MRRIEVRYGMDNATDMAGHLEIELDLTELARPGRRPKPLAMEVVRPLRPSDLALLASDAGSKPASLKRLSDRHHGLARLLAKGAGEAEAGAIMGYTPSRVSVLKGDPAFKELLEFYRDRADESFRMTLDQLGGLSADVVIELRERLEDNPEEFTNEELRRLLETTADRSGNGPTRKEEHTVNVNLSDRINNARERLKRERLAAIPDAEVVDVTPSRIEY